jgi:hypothetical protein
VHLDVVPGWIHDLNGWNTKARSTSSQGTYFNGFLIKGQGYGYSVNREGPVANAIASQPAGGLQDLIEKCQRMERCVISLKICLSLLLYVDICDCKQEAQLQMAAVILLILITITIGSLERWRLSVMNFIHLERLSN